MKVKRSQVSVSKLTNTITRIWAQDGWCYIPELKERQRFFVNENLFEMDFEVWNGVIPLPEHRETLSYSLERQKPRVWREQGEGWAELYEQVIPIQSKTMISPTPLLQTLQHP